MFKKCRVTLTLLICLLMLFSFSGPLWANCEIETLEPNTAASEFVVSPMMLYINRIYTLISIGTYGETTATGSITGYQGVTDKVWIYLYLQRYVNGSWQNYNSWYQSFDTFYGTLQGYDVVPHGYYYRVKGSYYAFSGSDYEHVYGYSNTVYY